jgi:hypothetical protein
VNVKHEKYTRRAFYSIHNFTRILNDAIERHGIFFNTAAYAERGCKKKKNKREK